jgi:hypothetical protein
MINSQLWRFQSILCFAPNKGSYYVFWYISEHFLDILVFCALCVDFRCGTSCSHMPNVVTVRLTQARTSSIPKERLDFAHLQFFPGTIIRVSSKIGIFLNISETFWYSVHCALIFAAEQVAHTCPTL